MSVSFWFAIAVVCVTVWALVKRYETRLVLLLAGFAMAIFALDPMQAFTQFDKSMTRGSLIIAICSAMGFAAVVSLTKCDVHLVALLMRPLRRLGIFLLPACMAVTSLCSLAIPSTAGLCAAVGPSMIPILIRSGFKPAMAAAAVVGSVTAALYNPGVSHNVFVAKLANMEVMDLIRHFSGTTLAIIVLVIVGMTLICFIYRDYKKPEQGTVADAFETSGASNLPKKVNFFYAIAPLVPVAILLYVSIFTTMKMSVATAMLIGSAYAVIVTRSDPQEVTRKFFDGMGTGYAKILGIIIAAGVFAAGLKAAGVIDVLVQALTNSNEWAKVGGALGPYVLGILTGSGDAATFAFNEAVTPHAPEFGMSIESLGYLAVYAGNFGRISSPLCGGLILVAGIAAVNPLDIVKRTAPVMAAGLIMTYFIL
ncbi:MAG: Anaerobic C4-dicarboxylate transporter DcuC [Burkholderia sp.]|jgi:C4-dicarboxylate transporter, DcuC family